MAAAAPAPSVEETHVIKLIIDTDIGGGGCNDVDDVVAICVGNALTDNGEVRCSLPKRNPPCPTFPTIPALSFWKPLGSEERGVDTPQPTFH
jgi:hypothetical protein